MYFDKKLCLFHQTFQSRSELFDAMFQKMNQAKIVKKSYLEGISTREEEYPTGLLVGKTGIAIPHTDSRHVNTSQICFASLEKPIEFSNMGDKSDKIQVELVFMLAMSQPHEQVQTLQNLISLFQDERAVEQLKQCCDEEEFIKILKRKDID